MGGDARRLLLGVPAAAALLALQWLLAPAACEVARWFGDVKTCGRGAGMFIVVALAFAASGLGLLVLMVLFLLGAGVDDAWRAWRERRRPPPAPPRPPGPSPYRPPVR
jgi:hypothetical protein